MKKFVIVAGMLMAFTANATVPDPPPVNVDCNSAMLVCQDVLHKFDDREQPSGNCVHSPLELYYYFQADSSNFHIDVVFSSSSSYYFYGPLNKNLPDACEQYTLNSATLITSGTGATSVIINYPLLDDGIYILVVRPGSCFGSVSIDMKTPELCAPEIPCENCVASFELTPGKKYMFSCWVKEDGAPVTKTSYTTPEVILSFNTNPGIVILPQFIPSGKIIDGWQRIEAEFTVPPNSISMQITLNVTTGDAFFDDIRIFPYDGSMKSYVYDPVTLRLMAELDERNYATIYEYDEEGKLIRVKKETERGVMTIQENKTSIKKTGQ